MARLVQAPIPVNVNGGAFTNITAKAFARYVEIDEDLTGAATAQGLTVKWPNGNVDNYAPSQLPIKIGNPQGGAGALVGAPAQTGNFPGGAGPTATLYCQITSRTATATNVRVTEDN